MNATELINVCAMIIGFVRRQAAASASVRMANPSGTAGSGGSASSWRWRWTWLGACCAQTRAPRRAPAGLGRRRGTPPSTAAGAGVRRRAGGSARPPGEDVTLDGHGVRTGPDVEVQGGPGLLPGGEADHPAVRVLPVQSVPVGGDGRRGQPPGKVDDVAAGRRHRANGVNY